MAPGRAEERVSIAVGITGASGAIYAIRTLAALLERTVHVELIVSDYGRRLLRDELGDAASVDRLILLSIYLLFLSVVVGFWFPFRRTYAAMGAA